MNKLDDKVIVDRDAAERILKHIDAHSCSNVSAFRHAFILPLERALAADLTGWVAVLVEATEEMQTKGADKIPDVYWGCESVAVDVFTAMLEASPPLPGGGG